MPDVREDSSLSWFRGRGGRRFGLEFALIIVIKLALLTLLWAFVIRPLPRADTSPTAIERHFSAPSSTESSR
ncbi:cytochrome oxidase putative small subunit CydP [Dokdonella sp.]|uniref:cytochrome oxidase putative small subunit CydP n=1 Tax=Dokdonella sp. TaxID=2291710 RepID=UPI003C3BD4C8